jgi:hypothetical protein
MRLPDLEWHVDRAELLHHRDARQKANSCQGERGQQSVAQGDIQACVSRHWALAVPEPDRYLLPHWWRENIKLDHTEVKKIKNFAPVGMKLMGFKPKSYLKVYHNVKHSYFMHPNEKKTKGVSQCSDALIKEMISQDKIAIVKFIPRETSTVRFCAMVAQEEKIDP